MTRCQGTNDRAVMLVTWFCGHVGSSFSRWSHKAKGGQYSVPLTILKGNEDHVVLCCQGGNHLTSLLILLLYRAETKTNLAVVVSFLKEGIYFK